MPAVVIPRVLRDTFGDDASEALVDLVNQLTEQSRQETIAFVEEKFERRLTEEFARLRSEDLVYLDKRITEEIAGVKGEIAGLRSELLGEIASLRSELLGENANLRSELREENANLRSELREENANLRSELRGEIADLRTQMADYRADLIRWMFIFWVGQLGAILAIIFVFFR